MQLSLCDSSLSDLYVSTETTTLYRTCIACGMNSYTVRWQWPWCSEEIPTVPYISGDDIKVYYDYTEHEIGYCCYYGEATKQIDGEDYLYWCWLEFFYLPKGDDPELTAKITLNWQKKDDPESPVYTLVGRTDLPDMTADHTYGTVVLEPYAPDESYPLWQWRNVQGQGVWLRGLRWHYDRWVEDWICTNASEIDETYRYPTSFLP